MKFQATLQLSGKTATGFEVPEDVVTALGASKRPPVRVTINGYTYRNTVATMAGTFMIGVAANHREAAGVSAGDVVEVELELDTEPREIEPPADFVEALDAEPEAKAFFDGLSYSSKRWHVESVEGAKKPETRQRRIEKSVGLLREGKAR